MSGYWADTGDAINSVFHATLHPTPVPEHWISSLAPKGNLYRDESLLWEKEVTMEPKIEGTTFMSIKLKVS